MNLVPESPLPASITPRFPFDSLALRELLVLMPNFAVRLRSTLRSWSGPLPLVVGPAISLEGVHPPSLWAGYLEAVRWQLEARPGVRPRGAPRPFHVLEVQDTRLAECRLEAGLQELWRVRGRVRRSGQVDHEALRVLWNLLRAARSGEAYRTLPARKEVLALQALLDATDLSTLIGPVQLVPPVGDIRLEQTLVLFSVSETGSFPHLHWQMTAAAYVLDTVFGNGDLEQVTWIYPRRRAALSLRPEEVFTVGRGRAVGREFRSALAGIDWTRLRQDRTQAEQRPDAGQLTPVLALHIVNSATKDTSARSALLGLPGAPSDPDRVRRAYLYEMKDRGALAMLEDGLLRPAGFKDDTLLVVGETPYGRKGFHLPLRMVPDAFRQVQPGLRTAGASSVHQARQLQEMFGLEAALSVLVGYLGGRFGHGRKNERGN
ncbi:hypothetical protein [Deinococcus sp. UYEF24]